MNSKSIDNYNAFVGPSNLSERSLEFDTSNFRKWVWMTWRLFLTVFFQKV